jgi:hypothetical protein
VPSAAVDILRCPVCGADVDEAAALDRGERAETRRTLAREVGRYLLMTSIFGGLFATWMWDEQRATARGDDSAPVLGILSLVLGTLLLIAVLLRSLGSDERAAEEARLRRAGSGLPGWVRVAGPLGFWAVLWLIRLAVWH